MIAEKLQKIYGYTFSAEPCMKTFYLHIVLCDYV